jgi:16S rRNA (adenine1518-N6/adenine1519-N6)-dimethyltransferase
MHPRQTLSYLRGLLQSHGISPKNKLGQNFLIDLNLVDLLVRTAAVGKDDLVLEIGSGTGSLTARLAEQAGAVLSVEVDPAFHSLATEIVAGAANVTLLCMDILKNKNHLNSRWLAALEELRASLPAARLKVVSNLPYAVATPVIANLLISDIPVERFVVTVQWEIALRLLASPGSKDYGALAVLVQSVADVELVRKLAPSVFWPRPQVESAIVSIVPDASRRQRIPSVQSFREFLRDLYTHRRKNLRSALSSLPTGALPKQEVDRRLETLGLSGAGRAEELSIDDHLRLCEVFHAKS